MAKYVFPLNKVEENFKWLNQTRENKNPNNIHHNFSTKEKLSEGFYANHIDSDSDGKITVSSKHISGNDYVNWIMRNGHLPIVNSLLENKELIDKEKESHFYKGSSKKKALANIHKSYSIRFTKMFEDCMFHFSEEGKAFLSLKINLKNTEFIQFSVSKAEIQGFVKMLEIIIEKNDHNYEIDGGKNTQKSTETLLKEAFNDVDKISEELPTKTRSRILDSLGEKNLSEYF
jgi:hypothetical protein